MRKFIANFISSALLDLRLQSKWHHSPHFWFHCLLCGPTLHGLKITFAYTAYIVREVVPEEYIATDGRQ